jgi:cysteine synthase
LTEALGAELVVIESVHGWPNVAAEDIRRMMTRAEELAAQPGHYATDQFNNPYTVPGMRESLGREIWEQTRGRLTAFCQGIGTASSAIGVAQELKPRGVWIQALEPAGSAAISGGASGSYAMQGWSGMVPPHWAPEWVDGVDTIEDEEAIVMTRQLAAEEGVFAGVSSGANVVGAIRLAERLGSDAVVVTLAVDSGFKYMSGPPFGG